MRNAMLAVGLLVVTLMVPFAVTGAEGNAEAGKAVFDKNCALCHYADQTETKMGPGLKGLFQKEKMMNGKPPTVENVMAIINEGGTAMPPYADILSADEKNDVLAYLQTL